MDMKVIASMYAEKKRRRQRVHFFFTEMALSGVCVTSSIKRLLGKLRARMAQWISGRLPPFRPRFDSRTRRLMWVEFVVGCHLVPRGFSPGSPLFVPPQKFQHI